MQLQITVDVTDPKFTRGSLIQIPNGTVLFVDQVNSSMPVSELQARGNAMARVTHQYVLVVQKSSVLRPGIVVLATEGVGILFAQAKIVKKFEGTRSSPDTLDLVFERTRGGPVRG